MIKMRQTDIFVIYGVEAAMHGLLEMTGLKDDNGNDVLDQLADEYAETIGNIATSYARHLAEAYKQINHSVLHESPLEQVEGERELEQSYLLAQLSQAHASKSYHYGMRPEADALRK